MRVRAARRDARTRARSPVQCAARHRSRWRAHSLVAQLMLAAATEVGRLAAGGQLGDAVAAAWTLLLSLGVDLQEAAVLLVRLVFRLGPNRLASFAHGLSGPGVEPH